MSTDLQIILVEDAIEDAEFVSRTIDQSGFTGDVLHFDNGKAAIEFFSQKENYCKKTKLVILDINMPGLSGKDVLKDLRSNKKIKDLPIVMLSSSMQEKDVMDCYALGVNSYVVKPSSFKQFNRVVSAVTNYWLQLNIIPHAI